MANCDLSIELVGDDRTYTGGDTIRGVVRVTADKDVKCSGLEVCTRWKTHGRGNVDSAVSDSKNVFAGQWVAGEQKEYAFELAVGHWPPTYHGHYLNVDHYVEARAKIPWGFDPKASVPFHMRPSRVPEDVLSRSATIELSGRVGAIISIAFFAIIAGIGFGIGAAGGWIMMAIFLALASLGGVFVLFRIVLPKIMLGDVACHLDDETFAPGQEVKGELAITPKKNVSINSVTLRLTAHERCVSGSGSNRTTHKHDIFDRTYTLQDATTLKSSTEHRFPLTVQLPGDAPYSIDLSDNDLIWQATLNVDIPRWPDWNRSLPLRVLPSGNLLAPDVPADHVAATMASSTHVPPAAAMEASPESVSDGEITFAETATHLWSVREDREQTAMLVEAVTGLTFDIQARVERRLLYAGDDDPHVYADGYAIWAHYPDPALPMVMYVPHELADEFEQIGRDVWQGRGTIVGWDARHGRLQIKAER